MRRSHRVVFIALVFVVLVTAAVLVVINGPETTNHGTAAAAPQPTLTVEVTSPQPKMWPTSITANGNINAWQEASIGNETDGLRLTEVTANVGDVVQKGQLLAKFATETIEAEVAESQAALAEAEAVLGEASENVKRAIAMQATGALSAQQIRQYTTAEKTAQARYESAQANLATQKLHLEQTRVLAPDNGVISTRAAAVGAVLPAGQELFRLIRGNRLEWRAEVAAQDLVQLEPGQVVSVTPVGGETITGTLRIVAPVVDTQTRNGLVFVDLPHNSSTRVGTFAHGHFEIGEREALTLPQSAVLLRDGFSYVMQVSIDSKVKQVKVDTGRRTSNLVEVLSGVTPLDKVVVTGGAFLGDGDFVRVMATPAQKDQRSRGEK